MRDPKDNGKEGVRNRAAEIDSRKGTWCGCSGSVTAHFNSVSVADASHSP